MKKVILFVLTCFAVSGTFAQSFFNGAGITVFVTTAQGSTAQAIGGLTYSPRVNFLENDHFSLSVGIPISLGASGSVNSQGSGDEGLNFLVNVPVLVNINIGAGSTKDNESRFGFFAGIGFGYQYGTVNETSYDGYGNAYDNSSTISTYGPMADAGVRIGVGQGTHNIEVRAQFMKGIDASQANALGIGAVFNF